MTSIGEWAFKWCSSLTSITIPNSVTSISSYAFDECSGLTSVYITDLAAWCKIKFNYTTSNPLYYAHHLYLNGKEVKDLVIPDIVCISNCAFSGCSGLTSVTIPNSVTSIGKNVFYNCTGLSSVTIPNSVTSIGDGAFRGCSGLTSITIPKSVTSIEECTFSGCSGLISITIPKSVTSIGNQAFFGCSGLTSITIPDSVTSIGYSAFSYCSSLTSVTIPNSVTSIGGYAFFGCSNLSFVRIEADIPIKIDANTFTNPSNAILQVPTGCKASYQTADYWKEFRKIVDYIEKGDVNVDEWVNVVDVVDIARFVVGNPANTFVEILADINKDDIVNLGDAVALVNDIAGDQNFVKAWNAPSTFTTDDALSLTERGGCLSMVLENERDYTAFQFDLYVPEDADVAQMMLNAERKQGHQLLYNKVEDGHYRVAALSTSNNDFNGNDGELMKIVLDGTASNEVSIRNIHFFDAAGRDYLFEDVYGSSPTSIRQIDNGQLIIDNEIYDLQGRKRATLQRGINIVGGKKIIKE